MKKRKKDSRPTFKCRCEYCMSLEKKKHLEDAKQEEINEYLEDMGKQDEILTKEDLMDMYRELVYAGESLVEKIKKIESISVEHDIAFANHKAELAADKELKELFDRSKEVEKFLGMKSY